MEIHYKISSKPVSQSERYRPLGGEREAPGGEKRKRGNRGALVHFRNINPLRPNTLSHLAQTTVLGSVYRMNFQFIA